MVKHPNADHDSTQPNGGHNNGKSSHLRWVFTGGGIAVIGLLLASIWWPNLTERTKFFTANLLNLVIALAVIAQALIYRRQRDIMRGQWRVMEEQGKAMQGQLEAMREQYAAEKDFMKLQIHNLSDQSDVMEASYELSKQSIMQNEQTVKAMQGQLAAIEKQAGFMEVQTEAALKAADMAMGQLIMMQRQEQAQHAGEAPYFGILGTPDIQGIEPGRTPKVSIIFMNGGRTPAWHFNAIACLVLGDSPNSPDHWFISPTSMGTFYHREAHKSVDFTETDLSFSEKQVTDITSGATSLFLIVTVTYKNIRDQLCPSRTFIFCYDRKRKYFADYQIT